MNTLPKFNVDKAWVAADPLTAVISSAVLILAVFGLWSWIGLSADQVAILGSALTTLGAGLRTIYNQRHRVLLQKEKEAALPKTEEN